MQGHATKFRMQSELRTLEADAIAEGAPAPSQYPEIAVLLSIGDLVSQQTAWQFQVSTSS